MFELTASSRARIGAGKEKQEEASLPSISPEKKPPGRGRATHHIVQAPLSGVHRWSRLPLQSQQTSGRFPGEYYGSIRGVSVRTDLKQHR